MSRVFTDLLSNSPKRSPLFSPGYEGTENMFYFLNEADICQKVKNTEADTKKTLSLFKKKRVQ